MGFAIAAHSGDEPRDFVALAGLAFWEGGHAAYFVVFPDPRIGLEGADFLRIAPRVNREQAIGERCSNMHGAAVDADGECSAADEPAELGQCRAIKQIDHVFCGRNCNVAPACENDGARGECSAEGDDFSGFQ